MAISTGLTVRHYERREAELPVELEIAPDHRAQLTFSATSGLGDVHIVDGVSVDFSSGGAGVASTRFVPRGVRGLLRVFDSTPIGRREDGSPIYPILFEHAVKVRRVTLTGHGPTYFVGVSFIDMDESFDSQIGAVLARIGEIIAASSPIESPDGVKEAADA